MTETILITFVVTATCIAAGWLVGFVIGKFLFPEESYLPADSNSPKRPISVVARGYVGDADVYLFDDGTALLRRRSKDGRWVYLRFNPDEVATATEETE